MGYSKEEKARYNAEYYERTKKLKGRRPASSNEAPRKSTSGPALRSKAEIAAAAKVDRLEGKVATLQKALSEATAALSASRQKERKKARESSDGKSTEKEKQASQKYRDKHKEELKSKARKSSSSSGGSSSSSSPSKSVSEMSSEELGARIIRIQRALADARRQLSSARQTLGQLAHAAITSDPNANEHFAQFRSERIPST